MAIDFFDSEIAVITNGMASSDNQDDEFESVTTSAEVSGMELRMLAPLIKNNQTPKFLAFPGYAKLYCLTLIVSDADNQMAGSIDLSGFPRIGDNETLPISKTLYYWQAANESSVSPNQIHVMCTVMKSKKTLRDTAGILQTLKDDEQYKGLTGQLSKLARNVTSFNAVTDTIVQIAGVVGKYLGNVEDKALGTVLNSYTTIHGDFDKTGVNTFSYTTRNVDFKFELTIRNKQQASPLIASVVSTQATPPLPVQPKQEHEEEQVQAEMKPL
ncbi:MAG: hypothetical protein INR73_07095 [Williamsia sp.]|nr:hypothetical protein [Williamsia sp.]